MKKSILISFIGLMAVAVLQIASCSPHHPEGDGEYVIVSLSLAGEVIKDGKIVTEKGGDADGSVTAVNQFAYAFALYGHLAFTTSSLILGIAVIVIDSVCGSMLSSLVLPLVAGLDAVHLYIQCLVAFSSPSNWKRRANSTVGTFAFSI